MKHLGDITKIDGHTAPVVDCIIGGSPCQDLSIAGKRAGLAGARSGLFMEQVRIAREMREENRRRGRTGNAIRPRYMVWENVLGAFSSNKGEDFKAVLEEIIRIAEPEAPDIPLPPKGKWPLADAYYGDGWSVAYRVLDAQFWGVPQRRRRIALVADFGGQTAPEILFERKSVSGDIAPSGSAGKGASAVAGTGVETAISLLNRNHEQHIICLMDQGGSVMETLVNKTGSLRAQEHGHQPVILQLYENHGQDSRITGPLDIAPTVAQKFGTGGNNTPLVLAVDCRNFTLNPDVNGTLQAKSTGGQSLNLNNVVLTVTEDGKILLDGQPCTVVRMEIRRLTPLECERLQGYPDGWTVLPPIKDMSEYEYDFWRRFHLEKAEREGKARINEAGDYMIWRKVETKDEDGETVETWEDTGKPYKHKTRKQMVAWYNKSFASDTDGPRYMALGNSIALPPWKWVLKRIAAHYERDATMASLFDGIGGFPLLWEQLNGKGTCLWASEIEAFSVAVTRRHFEEGKAR